MNISIGIVGLPNAGKSTLFNALLKKQIAFAAAYPFATIEPNVGVVPVPDKRLEALKKLVEEEIASPDEHRGRNDVNVPIVPATVEFVDIAGLVKGASQGEGLGNKFLSHIREVDLICHVVRVFKDSDVSHVAGEIDPLRDKEIVEAELILSDLQTLEKQTEPRGVTDKEKIKLWELIGVLKNGLGEGKLAKEIITNPNDQNLLKPLNLLTIKPFLYALNVSEDDLAHPVAKDYSSFTPVFTISAKVEAELAGLSENEQTEYLTSLGLSESGLNRLIRHAYNALGLISFLTAGEKEVRAWTIVKGTKAPQAAGVIHTDFEKGFIKAEVVSYDDLISAGSYKRAREKGNYRLEGREYEMKDGDVVEFKVST